MISAFDILDKRHRAPEPIKPEPLLAGADCPDPNCRGRMEWSLAERVIIATPVLACDCCGWVQERRS